MHSRTEYWTHTTKYFPCEVVECRGEDVLVQDAAGRAFGSHLSMLGLFPTGYRFEEGKLRKDGVSMTAAPDDSTDTRLRRIN